MASTTLDVIVSLTDKITGPLKGVQNQVSSLEDKLGKGAVAASQKFALGIAAGATALGAFGYKAIQVASDAEQTAVAFRTMLGSAEKADAFVRDMKEFAKKTPLEMTDIKQASQTLLAFGINAKDVLPNLQRIGDVALGDKNKFASLSLAFAQVQSTGRLMGQDLLQMVNQGFNPLQVMSEKSGKSMAKLKKEMEDGKISAADVTAAFVAATSEGGRFFGGMEAQSKTLGGMISNLQDAWTQFLENQGAPLIEWAKQVTAVLISFVQDTLPKVIAGLGQLATFLSENQSVIWIFAGAIIGGLVPALISLAGAAIAAVVPLLPFIAVGAAVAAAIYGIVYAVRHWDEIRAKAIEIWGAVTGYISEVVGNIVGWLSDQWNSVMNTIIGVWESIKTFFSNVWQGMADIAKLALALIAGLVILAFSAIGIDIIYHMEGIWATIVYYWDEIKKYISDKIQEIIASVYSMISSIQGKWQVFWGAVKTIVSVAWDGIKNWISEGLQWIVDKIAAFAEPILKAFSVIWDGIKGAAASAMDSMMTVIKEALNWVLRKINSLIGAVNRVASTGAAALGISIPNIPEIPLLAKGGVVTKPTLAVVGEAGPEAVIPLNQAGKFGVGGGGGNVTIVVNGDVTGQDLIERVARELTKMVKLSTATV